MGKFKWEFKMGIVKIGNFKRGICMGILTGSFKCIF